MRLFALAAYSISVVFFCSCAAQRQVNPSFPLTEENADVLLEGMQATPRALPRPLIIVGGFHDFGVPGSSLAKRFKAIFQDDRIISISFEGCHTFQECKERLIEAIDTRFPASRHNETVVVDVVAVSMGGLVARYSASSDAGKKLSIRRLFTIASPHRGSQLALLPAVEPIQRDMRPHSAFLERLSHEEHDYEVIPYIRLRDELVCVTSAAPYGHYPWWVPYAGFASPHNSSYRDERFIADISARLRGDSPFTTCPPALAPVQ